MIAMSEPSDVTDELPAVPSAGRGPFSDEGLARFAAETWGRSVYVDRISPDDLEALRREFAGFDIQTLIARADRPVSLWFSDLSGQLQAADVPPADALKFYSAGHTVYMAGVTSPLVEQWRQTLAAHLGRHPSNYLCSLFASQPNRKTGAHFDELENFTIQLRGTKRWRIAENRNASLPTVNFSMGGKRAHSEELWLYAEQPMPETMPAYREVTLTPGSILYLPRGTWHEVVAPDEESLSLLVAFPSVTWIDALLPALRTLLVQRPMWREHAVFEVGPDAAAAQAAKVRELWADLGRVLDAADPRWLLPPYRPGAVDASAGAGVARRYLRNPLCSLGRYATADGAHLDLVAQVHLGELSRRQEAQVPARWAPVLEHLAEAPPAAAAPLAPAALAERFPALRDELPELLAILCKLQVVLLAPA
jgi:50S ribosomal protein L16 3-hydroxylase